MPKSIFLNRYSVIIKRLEKSPATFKEIQSFLQRESELQDKNFTISIRTFQRDLKEIYELLNYEITCERTGYKRYYIKERPEEKEHSHRLLESYEIINAINASQQHSNYVFLESRQSKGLEHFNGLLYSIQNKLILKFEHCKYWNENVTQRTVHPLGLKESLGRWYLLAVDTKDAHLKTFGLDRISNLEITKSRFKEKYNYNFKAMFADSFGIISLSDSKPQEVILEFSIEQGKYVKSYPLHHSQEVILENSNKVQIKLIINITHDFVMEIMRFNEEVKVMKPAALVREIKQRLKSAIMQYN